MKIKNNNLFIKSLKLKGGGVESILLPLHLQKEMSVSKLLSEVNGRFPETSSKTIKKYLVYLVDYNLISYNGQRRVYQIEENGLDLLSYIDNEKKRLKISNSENFTITLKGGD